MSVDGADPIAVRALPAFEWAIEELVENAILHGGPESTVTVTVERCETPFPDAVRVRVSDDGPGIPSIERQVFHTEPETPLSHPTGFGLWIVQSLVALSGGRLRLVETGESGTAIDCYLHEAV